MGIETLIAKIDEKVDAQIAEANLRADQASSAEAARIAADADEKCAVIIKRAEDKARSYLSREALRCELDAKNATLSMKNKTIDAAFEKVAERILALEEDEKAAFYSKTIRECAPDYKKCSLIASDDNLSAAEKLKDTFGFTSVSKTAGNGVFIVSGEIYDIDLSVGAIVADLREKYTSEAAAILFAGE